LNAPASYAAMEIGCTGANFTVTQGEVSGEQAVALGYDLIRSGRADVVLAGGGDALADFVISAYRSFRALSSQRGGEEWCSPYDAGRNGIVLGEGAAMLLLESATHARQRGARPYAEMEDYLSFGIPASPYDWPRHAAAAPARLQALLRRAAQPAVDLVCGSANSSRHLDACEVDILARVFGEAAPTISLTSIKGAIGEFGAAGALTAVAACLALRHGMVPPLCHLQQPAVGPALRFAPRTALPRALGRALLLSIARGGAAMALLLRRPAQ
jgi:3-oxoacyl-[acyl-carrier-protein] synthase II